jgi:hypothetical protein
MAEIWARSLLSRGPVRKCAMASPVQFAVDDSSPALAYAPFADSFGQPDLAAGWNPYFVGSGFVASLGQAGVGESQHITSRNGASLSLRWHGACDLSFSRAPLTRPRHRSPTLRQHHRRCLSLSRPRRCLCLSKCLR